MLYDDKARPIPGGHAAAKHHFTTNAQGGAFTDADHLRQLCERCLDEVLQHPAAMDIEGVGMATFVGNLVGVDAEGAACTELYTYADSQNSEDVIALHSQIDAAAFHQRTGTLHHTAYWPARLRWLKRTHQADIFERAVRWVDFGTYCYRRWFERDVPMSNSVASWSGMLDRHTLAWDRVWLDVLGLDGQRLPPIADFRDGQAGLSNDYAKRWPVLQDVPFFLAVGDGAAANVGSGATTANTLALTVGTTAALRRVLPGTPPRVPAGLWSYRIDQQQHLLGGATSEGGNIFAWVQDTFKLPDGDLNAQLAQREPDGHGLTFLPLLAGERAPGWAANARGTLHGLRLDTSGLDVLQAALEGVALRLALIAEALIGQETHEKASVDAVMAGGGALNASHVWARMIANAFDEPLHLVGDAEVTARGVAILVLNALGRCRLDDHPLPVKQVIEPEPTSVERLRAARERQQGLYQRLIAQQD